MKPSSISAEALFEAQRESLRWEWIAGHAHPERHFDDAAVRDDRADARISSAVDVGLHRRRDALETGRAHASGIGDRHRCSSNLLSRSRSQPFRSRKVTRRKSDASI